MMRRGVTRRGVTKELFFALRTYFKMIMILFCCKFQYYGAWSNYQQAISYFCKEQKYRMQAINIAKDEGLLPVPKRSDSKRRNKV